MSAPHPSPAKPRARAPLDECVEAFLAQGFSVSRVAVMLAAQLTERNDFVSWPASIDKHHTYEGGLLEHTLEVVLGVKAAADTANSFGLSLDRNVLFLAAALHDIGKVEVYLRGGNGWKKGGGYTKSLHVTHSIRLARECLKDSIPADVLEAVCHCIGAHHGRLDYGALWEPAAPEAWALHFADATSAFCFGGRPNVS